ncbi:hypothetical protein Nmel_005603 [Mimus melanotis]
MYPPSNISDIVPINEMVCAAENPQVPPVLSSLHVSLEVSQISKYKWPSTKGGKLHQCKAYYGLLTLSDLLKYTIVCLAAERSCSVLELKRRDANEKKASVSDTCIATVRHCVSNEAVTKLFRLHSFLKSLSAALHGWANERALIPFQGQEGWVAHGIKTVKGDKETTSSMLNKGKIQNRNKPNVNSNNIGNKEIAESVVSTANSTCAEPINNEICQSMMEKLAPSNSRSFYCYLHEKLFIESRGINGRRKLKEEYPLPVNTIHLSHPDVQASNLRHQTNESIPKDFTSNYLQAHDHKGAQRNNDIGGTSTASSEQRETLKCLLPWRVTGEPQPMISGWPPIPVNFGMKYYLTPNKNFSSIPFKPIIKTLCAFEEKLTTKSYHSKDLVEEVLQASVSSQARVVATMALRMRIKDAEHNPAEPFIIYLTISSSDRIFTQRTTKYLKPASKGAILKTAERYSQVQCHQRIPHILVMLSRMEAQMVHHEDPSTLLAKDRSHGIVPLSSQHHYNFLRRPSTIFPLIVLADLSLKQLEHPSPKELNSIKSERHNFIAQHQRKLTETSMLLPINKNIGYISNYLHLPSANPLNVNTTAVHRECACLREKDEQSYAILSTARVLFAAHMEHGPENTVQTLWPQPNGARASSLEAYQCHASFHHVNTSSRFTSPASQSRWQLKPMASRSKAKGSEELFVFGSKPDISSGTVQQGWSLKVSERMGGTTEKRDPDPRWSSKNSCGLRVGSKQKGVEEAMLWQSCLALAMPFAAAKSLELMNPNPTCNPNPSQSTKRFVRVRLVNKRKGVVGEML